MSLLIGDNCVVSIHYTLTDDEGTVLDSSRDSEPMNYLHGAGNIIPGLEDELTGKSIGASFKVSVAPEDAYGVLDEELIQVVPRGAFEGTEDIQPGMQFHAEGPHGGVQVITVTVVEGDDITIDANHPLAGKTLHFDVSIEGIRAATEEEIDHGHVH
jgi:FKBP-type peptidyl-prolyl cis-trans isomerase SlyD